MNIPFLSFSTVNAQVKPQILNAFEGFFDDAWYVLGQRVRDFETAYAQYNHTAHCVGLSNGLDALHIALKTLGIGPGDEVIVPSNTYIATVLAISYVGARPVFSEPDINTYNLDPVGVKSVITERTRAIMPVHLYGQACDMQGIMQIADTYGLFVVEDNAQSQGASFNGKLTGSWGHINGTSFYPGKNLGAYGDAGAITTNSQDLAEKAAILRNYGSEKKYYNDVIGHNMRLDECQAEFLYIKLKYLDQWTAQRQQIAKWYNEALQGIGDLILPAVLDGATHVYHIYLIRTKHRNQLQQYLSHCGIGTLIHYPVPPYQQKAYEHLGFKRGDYPLADLIADTCLSLPLWPGMTQDMVQVIASHLKDFYNKKH